MKGLQGSGSDPGSDPDPAHLSSANVKKISILFNSHRFSN